MQFASAPTSESRARVLIVDDHPNVAQTLARALEKASFATPFEILTAQNGHEAMEVSADRDVDILITDFLMPGMSGLSLIESMEEAGRKPNYIVLITAYDAPDLGDTVKRLQVDKYLAKPVRPETIQSIVGRQLDGRVPHVMPDVKQPDQYKILIADDYPDNQRLLSVRLSREGYTFLKSMDGEETLEMVRRHRPDLVLLDINLPKKDGLEVLTEIRADPEVSYIPVIVLTAARVGAHDVLAGLNLGADDYITKPFDWNELAARVKVKLRVKRIEDELRQRNRELSVLPAIGQELSVRLDLDDLGAVLLDRIVAKWGADDGRLMIFQPNGELYVRSASDPESGDSGQQARARAYLQAGMEGHALRDRTGILIRDTQQSKRWHPRSDSQARSAICVPLLGRIDVLGVFTLLSNTANFFSDVHLPLMYGVASQAAIAVENAQLYSLSVQEQRRLSAVLESAADAMLVTDEQGRVALLNPAGRQLFDDFQALFGQALPQDSGYADLIRMMEEVRDHQLPARGDIAWPDGRVFTCQITPVDGGGQVAVLHDITYFKNLDELKNEFIAAASHDLKNPINSVMGFSDLLPKVGPLNETQSDFVGRVRSAAEQMHELVLNIMELLRTEIPGASAARSVCDLGELAETTLQEFDIQADKKAQRLSLEAQTGLQIEADIERLRHVARNLIGNAIKYTAEGGRIVVQVQLAEGQAEFSVRDNGIGIPEAEFPNLFRTFYRIESDETLGIQGNGLGLAIVQSVVEQHGGSIHVESELGSGSIFRVRLPLADPPANGDEAGRSESHA
jgi:signal transduction histidine kinase/DNA-binding response OmpR family regulator